MGLLFDIGFSPAAGGPLVPCLDLGFQSLASGHDRTSARSATIMRQTTLISDTLAPNRRQKDLTLDLSSVVNFILPSF